MGTVRATLERKNFIMRISHLFFYPSVPPVSEFLRCTTIASIRPHLSSPSPFSSFPLDHKIPPFAFEKRNGVGTEKGGEGGSDSGDFLPSSFGHCTTLLIRVCVGLGMH